MYGIYFPKPTVSKLMTVQQAAFALNVSPSHVYRMLASGVLVGVKIGQCRRVSRTSVEALLRKCDGPESETPAREEKTTEEPSSPSARPGRRRGKRSGPVEYRHFPDAGGTPPHARAKSRDH